MKTNVAYSSIEEIADTFSLIEKALCNFPHLHSEAFNFLFGSGESLQPGLIEICVMTARGTGGMTISFHVTDRLREFVAALSAGNLESMCVN